MDSHSSSANNGLPNNHFRGSEIQGDQITWEYHTVSVTRVSGYGFGIAVSGGRDNPHFANGDPSIAVSDVLKGGPAEDRLQVNDRMISVNGVSLENVEYATAVQVLRDSGNTVTLMVKRRSNLGAAGVANHHHHASHSHSHSTSHSIGHNSNQQQQQLIKVAISKTSKKEDFGLVLGCRLFVKEISSKVRDQLAMNGLSLQEGDIVARINNTNTNDVMSLKEARKIMDNCKDQLNLAVIRDVPINASALPIPPPQSPVYSHAAQVSNCSNIAEESSLFAGGANTSYSAQNLYVQPPTRPVMNSSMDEKSNLVPRGRSRNPLMDVSQLQLDRPTTPTTMHSPNFQLDPPRPPPPREEDFYASRRQLYEDDPLLRSKQSAEPRFISFQKEGSVGIRLTGGNEAGIFVTAVQPGSPASLQGLTPGDKILKVNDMDMSGVTREEAVLFLLSLQDRIELIVQHCREEYDYSVANQRGDSFHIKCHFHCDNPIKGEMTFKAGDIFRVVDTLHNGVVGAWQVMRIGRGQQEIQRGVIPNKARAEELATAQFNATKKGNSTADTRTGFFKRRRPMHRRSKSLSRENWDDVLSDSPISKFPAYERVVLRHPGFVRPVVIFGPVADLAHERLLRDFPDKFTSPLQVIQTKDDKEDDGKRDANCGIVRLSNIRDITDRGKHALLDIAPNAVDRLNYAQFYPIVVFVKAESKHQIKQLRHGIPKTLHKSSKKLLVQCQKLDQVWSHVFSDVLTINDVETWYRKLRDMLDQLQGGAVWMSENKPSETLSDEFLFPMNTTTSRLSYASSPESDLEMSPGPSTSLSLGNLPQLVKSCSDPSIATNQDNLDHERDLNNGTETRPPPYCQENKYGFYNDESGDFVKKTKSHAGLPIFGKVPELPPRIDRASKPAGGYSKTTPPSTLSPVRHPMSPNISVGSARKSAQERLFGSNHVIEGNADFSSTEDYSTRSLKKSSNGTPDLNSLDRTLPLSPKRVPINGVGMPHLQQQLPLPATNGTYDTVPSYGSFNNNNGHMSMQEQLGPNAPDDLKSVPPPGHSNDNFIKPNGDLQPTRSAMQDHTRAMLNGAQNAPVRSSFVVNPDNANSHSRHMLQSGPNHNMQRPNHMEMLSPTKMMQPATILKTKTDYGRYSRNNSASQADYAMRTAKTAYTSTAGIPFKPVPPPKPKNYQPQQRNQMSPGYWENGNLPEPPPPQHQPNGGFYPSGPTHYHSGHSQHSNNNHNSNYGHSGINNGNNGPYSAQPPIYGYPPQVDYQSHMSAGNDVPPLPPNHHLAERNALDLAGSREQRGSAFELYRKPHLGGVGAGPHQNLSCELESPTYQYAQFKFANDTPPNPSYRPPPPDLQHIYNMKRQQQQQQQQQFSMVYNQYDAPPQLPQKPKKKSSILKSPFNALKKAFGSKSKTLKRQNSMKETVDNPIQIPNSRALRRQHSMIEPSRSAGYAITPDLSIGRRNIRGFANNPEYLSYHEPFTPNAAGAYRNMEPDAIYGNCGHIYDNRIDAGNVYANRSEVELEQEQQQQQQQQEQRYQEAADDGTKEVRIRRRHSMAERHAGQTKDSRTFMNGRYDVPPPPEPVDQREDIYQTRSGAFLLDSVPDRRRCVDTASNQDEVIYQSRKEMHRDHLYQSRDEMHKRLQQSREDESIRNSQLFNRGRVEDEQEEEVVVVKDQLVYQSRKELKERGFKTRTQLRDHIYQSRLEAMQSMAEPVYVSKSEIQNQIVEEPTGAEHPDDDEVDRHSVSSNHDLSLKAVIDHLDNGFIESEHNESGNPNETTISCNEEDEVTLTNSNQSDIQKSAFASVPDQTVPAVAPMTPRSIRDPYHISNMIKRTAPPASPIMAPAKSAFSTSTHHQHQTHPHASQTSIETQFTSATVSSLVSLPTGPPNAQSTPYTSQMALPASFYPPLREQTTTSGIFDEHGGTLSDNVWNVSIHIPAGAIPTGRQQEIYFTVTDPRLSQTVGGPPLDMENGETMLSPLVMCGPQGIEFLRPVTLNIPHCAGRTASLGLALKATDSEKNLCTNWDNIDLPTNAAAHTVSVQVDHF